MKTVAALAAGVLLSLITFIAGVLGTAMYLSDPQSPNLKKDAEVSDLWTSEPVVVATDTRHLERVAARQAQDAGFNSEDTASTGKAGGTLVTTDPEDDAAPDVDMVETGSTPDIEPMEASYQSDEHVGWCAARYNSYRAQDDTYQPYHGARRRCTSPYQDVIDAGISGPAGASEETAFVHNLGDDASAEADPMMLQSAYAVDEEHVQRCSARYRSYRIEDNTYQPFRGGPRRQCQ